MKLKIQHFLTLWIVSLVAHVDACRSDGGGSGSDREAINCNWGNWQDWTPCSVNCGNDRGTRSRQRSVRRQASNGGAECRGQSLQEQSCRGTRPSINCEWDHWNEWSPCSVTCGSGGTQTRRRNVITHSLCGGAGCMGSSWESRSCLGAMPAINCEWGDWTDWTPCSITCGRDGTRKRNRAVAQSEFCGGEVCIGTSEEEELCTPGCERGVASVGFCENCPSPFTGTCCDQLVEDGDPCTWHFELDESWRSTNNVAKGDNFHCYSDLKNFWYRFTGEAGGEMPTKCVKANSCGVLRPIWLFGKHPSSNDGVVIRNVCVSESSDGETDCCTQTHTIEIKNCNNEYYVYNLSQPQDCNQGFCAGNEVPCPPGTNSLNGYTPLCIYDPPPNTVFPVLEYIEGDDQFVCSFETTPSRNVTHTVRWYASDTELQHFISPVGQGYSATLDKDKLRATLKDLNSEPVVEMYCSLSSQYVDPDDGTIKSKLSEENKSNFLDFQV